MFSKGGVVRRMMSARMIVVTPRSPLQQTGIVLPEDRPRVNYHYYRTENDPFPEPSLLEQIDSDQHEVILTEVSNFKRSDREKGLLEKKLES